MPANSRPSLTDRQREIFEFLRARILSGSITPSLREIGARFEIRSTNGVARHLKALEKKGYITTEHGKARTIRIPGISQTQPTTSETSAGFAIPLLGKVAAGLGLLADEHREGELVVDPDLFGGSDTFALRVQGDSMIEEGIHAGDLVVVRPQRTARNGEIVVALVGEEATVKYFHRRTKYVELKPANPAYEPIIIPHDNPDFMILGKVIGLMRRY